MNLKFNIIQSICKHRYYNDGDYGCRISDGPSIECNENNCYIIKQQKCKHEFKSDGSSCIHCGLTWIEINNRYGV